MLHCIVNDCRSRESSNIRSRTSSGQKVAANRVPSSTSSTFEADLMRLINTDISVSDLHRTLSDKVSRCSDVVLIVCDSRTILCELIDGYQLCINNCKPLLVRC